MYEQIIIVDPDALPPQLIGLPPNQYRYRFDEAEATFISPHPYKQITNWIMLASVVHFPDHNEVILKKINPAQQQLSFIMPLLDYLQWVDQKSDVDLGQHLSRVTDITETYVIERITGSQSSDAQYLVIDLTNNDVHTLSYAWQYAQLLTKSDPHLANKIKEVINKIVRKPSPHQIQKMLQSVQPCTDRTRIFRMINKE